MTKPLPTESSLETSHRFDGAKVRRHIHGHTRLTLPLSAVAFMQSNGGHKGLTAEMNFKGEDVETAAFKLVIHKEAKWSGGIKTWRWREARGEEEAHTESSCQSSGA